MKKFPWSALIILFLLPAVIGNLPVTHEIPFSDRTPKIEGEDYMKVNMTETSSKSMETTDLIKSSILESGSETIESYLTSFNDESDTGGYWLVIENDTNDLDPRLSTAYVEVAQKFEIIEETANITQIQVYIKYIDLDSGDDIPHGVISIFNDNNGAPGIPLGTASLEEGFAFLNLGVPIGPAWITYTLQIPIEVTMGEYWIVLSDTGDQAAGYWEWYTQADTNNEDAGDWAARSSHEGDWYVNPIPVGDLLSSVKILETQTSPPEENPNEDPQGNSTLYYFVFKSPGIGAFEYNLTFVIKNSSDLAPFHHRHQNKGKSHSKSNGSPKENYFFDEESSSIVFIVEIGKELFETNGASSRSHRLNRNVLGVVLSRIHSFLSTVSETFSYRCLGIIFKIKTSNASGRSNFHDVVITFSVGRILSSTKI
ncbi:MAG: hypothetical protein ACFFE8_10005 [Candidatus Heimdallarchaeota archaeon]